MKKPRISIIGLGSVGMALLRVLSEKGYEVYSVFNRSEIKTDLLKNYPNTTFGLRIPEKEESLGDLIFIAVSDDAISEVVEGLVQKFPEVKKNFVHLSGTHSSEILSPLKKGGGDIASFHPMQSITRKTNSFSGTWFDIEGDDALLTQLEILADNVDAKTFRVQPEAKPLLHASAVVASNYLVVLSDMVAKISAQASIPESTTLKALKPLMMNTLDNITELGVTEALTGPIARGDVETVSTHLDSLKNVPEVRLLYKTLGREAVKIAEKKSGRSQSLQQIKKLLS